MRAIGSAAVMKVQHPCHTAFPEPPLGSGREKEFNVKSMIIALPLAALLVACGSSTGSGGGASSGDIRIVGSSTVYPFTKAVAEDFMRSNPGISVTVESTGTGGGMKLWCAGV